MTTAITAVGTTELALLVDQARVYAHASRSGNTRRAYAVQLASWEAWCSGRQICPLPALGASVALYLTDRAQQGASIATMAQSLAALSQAHTAAGHPSPRFTPEVQEVWKGIRRTHGVAQRQATPLTPAQLRSMAKLGTARDRALMLLGFAGAFRRSELVGLDVGDVMESEDGLTVTIRRSKTDQEGKGRTVGIPYGSDPDTCAVRAVRTWMASLGRTDGPVFVGERHGKATAHRLDGRDVARLVQRLAKRAGVPLERLSGHSLRAGLATAAAKAGKSAQAIAKQTGHKSVAMVQRYIRDAELFADNAASGIGL